MASEDTTSLSITFTWKAALEAAAFIFVEAAVWDLMEGFPKWMLISTIVIGVAFITSLNVKVGWKFFRSLPWLLAIAYAAILVYALGFSTPESNARLRIFDIVPLPTSASSLSYPALNVYWNNGGSVTVNGEHSHSKMGFASSLPNGKPFDDAVAKAQDELLHWDGWSEAMEAHRNYEVYSNDPIQFFTIPEQEGQTADLMRNHFDNVTNGKEVLVLLIMFKYFDGSKVVVTEDCSLFAKGWTRHLCGTRTFVEHTPVIGRVKLLFRAIFSGLWRAFHWVSWFGSQLAFSHINLGDPYESPLFLAISGSKT